MASEPRLFDADGHVFERDAEIFEHLRPPFQGRRELLRSALFPAMDTWNRTALSVAGGYVEGSTARRKDGETGEEGTADQWLDVLDTAGIGGTVLYPTHALGFGRVKEREWAVALAQAYNDWMYERFLQASPRLNAIALLPIQDPAAAAAELRRAVTGLRMVGGIMVAGHRQPFGDAQYYPIYEVAQELDTVIAVHAGGPGIRFEMLDRAIEARCLGHPSSLMVEMTSMMFSGVFDRYPRLRFSFMEGGVAWALFLAERMQEAYEQWSVQAPELKCEPKEHLTSGRIFFHCELEEEILPYAVQYLGDQVLLYASDYPHLPPARVYRTLAAFRARSDLSDATKARILGENARRLYKVQQPAGALSA
jgi:predicted TIM-barrel fold metal-dependent hydrolase